MMIERESKLVIDCFYKSCESDVIPQDWKTAAVISISNDKVLEGGRKREYSVRNAVIGEKYMKEKCNNVKWKFIYRENQYNENLDNKKL